MLPNCACVGIKAAASRRRLGRGNPRTVAARGDAAERLVESRSAQLAGLLGDIPADERDQLMDLLHRLAASLLAALGR